MMVVIWMTIINNFAPTADGNYGGMVIMTMMIILLPVYRYNIIFIVWLSNAVFRQYGCFCLLATLPQVFLINGDEHADT